MSPLPPAFVLHVVGTLAVGIAGWALQSVVRSRPAGPADAAGAVGVLVGWIGVSVAAGGLFGAGPFGFAYAVAAGLGGILALVAPLAGIVNRTFTQPAAVTPVSLAAFVALAVGLLGFWLGAPAYGAWGWGESRHQWTRLHAGPIPALSIVDLATAGPLVTVARVVEAECRPELEVHWATGSGKRRTGHTYTGVVPVGSADGSPVWAWVQGSCEWRRPLGTVFVTGSASGELLHEAAKDEVPGARGGPVLQRVDPEAVDAALAAHPWIVGKMVLAAVGWVAVGAFTLRRLSPR